MKKIKVLATISVIAISSLAFAGSASAATKSITCYKGTQSKVVKATNPKCPSGWSTKKPAAAPSKAAAAFVGVATGFFVDQPDGHLGLAAFTTLLCVPL